MKITGRDVTKIIGQIPPHFLCFLFHGADRGLIKERATMVAKQICPDLDDPFSSVTLRGDDVKADPARLADEVGAVSIFGGERLVRLQGSGTELLASVKNAVPLLQQGTRLVIEASDTTTRHALVKYCEAAQNCASIGCYGDEERDIGQMAQTIFARDSISIEKDALNLLISRLGSDRLASRSEIEKLALMAGPQGTLSVHDVENAIGDSSAQALDSFTKAILSSDISGLTNLLEKARMEDIAPIAIIRQCAQTFRQLYFITAQKEKGEAVATAIGQLRPPVHFKAKPVLSQAAMRLNSKMALSFWKKMTAIETELKTGKAGDPYSHLGQALLGFCLRLKR